MMQNLPPEEIAKLLREIDAVAPDSFGYNMHERQELQSKLCLHPYLFFPLGFTEAIVHDKLSDKTADLRNRYTGSKLEFGELGGYKRVDGGISKELQLFHLQKNKWFFFSSLYQEDLFGSGKTVGRQEFRFVSEDGEWIDAAVGETLEKIAREASLAASPTPLWAYSDPLNSILSNKSDSIITGFSSDLLSNLAAGKMTLEQLRWQDLEDIIYELLKQRGLEVQATPRQKDGGRDIIAKGEVFPGLVTSIAVEVKHKKKVGILDLSSALYRNRNFPCIMLATSGGFTAGVVKDSLLPENALRLHLADGNKVQSWIRGTRTLSDPRIVKEATA